MSVKRGIWVLFGLIVISMTTRAQVPLFLDEEDSTLYLVSDTGVTHKVIPKRGNRVGQPIVHAKSSRDNTRIDSLLVFAELYLGNRYRRGGTSTQGFDCSGYTMTVFKHLNIKLPHTSAGQSLVGVPVSMANIQKGDLIFFRGGNRRSSRIGHVGIVVSEKGEPVRFIHSSTSEGIRYDNLSAPYFRNRYVKSVRVPELYQ